MDEHKRVIQECVNKVAGSKNSSVIEKDKYDKVVTYLSESASGDSKFRWWVEKKRCYRLLNFAELGLNNVLCVPAKKQNENDTTMLSEWRIQTHSENIADILLRLHWTEQNHVGYKKMLSQVQSRYEGIPRCVVQEVCRTCPVCLMSVKQTNNSELRPIISSGFLTRAQIDLIDMRHKPDGDYSYIAHYMDHWSKFHVIWPLKRKTADEVASGLNQRVFPYLGLPRIIHSDNGREFVNRVIREVVKDWGGEDVMFVNGRPRHSQSQGLVEQGNATIERHIANKRATLELADDYPWASWLPKIQYNMNTEVAGGTKKTPYEVVFGQPPRTNIIPDAKAADGIINEEDLPFELNPDSKDNEAQTETQQRIEDDDTEQSNETLPPVSRPTPKPRKRPVPIPMLRPDARTLFPPEDSSTTEVTEQLLIAQADPSDSCDQDNSSKMVDEGTEQLLIAQADPSDSCDQDNSSKMVDEGTEQLLIAQADPSDSCDQDNTSKMVDEDITDSTAKHFKVREESDANYRANAERMKLKYSKRKRVTQETFNEGDLVTIRVPKIDRSSTDQPRLVTKVASTRGKDGNVWYKLKCKFGLLQGWYRTGELMPYGEICNIAFDNEALISLREAARKENPNMVQRKKCMCQGPCSKNCYCVKNNLKCTSHCHPKKTCRNVEVTVTDINLEDRQIVNNGEELTDKHIFSAQQLLKKQFPSNNGFRDTVTLGTRSNPEPAPYIQILHVDGNHWLTIAATNPKGPVEVFDSLKTKKLSDSTLQSIKSYHGQTCNVKLMNNQKQQGFRDCGLFAIANATSLCFGDDPTFLEFEQNEMRQHLLDCIEKGQMTPFPHNVSDAKRKKRCRMTQSC